MFEYLTLLLPFLLLGFIAAGLSRISGVALSMIIVPTLLIWGGYTTRCGCVYAPLCSV